MDFGLNWYYIVLKSSIVLRSLLYYTIYCTIVTHCAKVIFGV